MTFVTLYLLREREREGWGRRQQQSIKKKKYELCKFNIVSNEIVFNCHSLSMIIVVKIVLL